MQLDVKQIGHLRYFRAQSGAVLWPRILDRLGQHGLQTNVAAQANSSPNAALLHTQRALQKGNRLGPRVGLRVGVACGCAACFARACVVLRGGVVAIAA